MESQPKRPPMDVRDLGEYKNLKPSHIYDMVARREIPHIRIGKLLRFEPDRIDEWFQSQRVEPKPRTK